MKNHLILPKNSLKLPKNPVTACSWKKYWYFVIVILKKYQYRDRDFWRKVPIPWFGTFQKYQYRDGIVKIPVSKGLGQVMAGPTLNFLLIVGPNQI